MNGDFTLEFSLESEFRLIGVGLGLVKTSRRLEKSWGGGEAELMG